ncbi:butyrophilin-like protein 2 [Trichomycterus rosablanca]|uniref:butyrophilin-like protein 2 n=1 Tax=Trichomycterus rosablanca TaxID=2290929 RepID=UPI002F357ED8
MSEVKSLWLMTKKNNGRFRVLGPSDPLSVQLGGSVMLPCYVETPLPMDELEVEWKRTDTLVHLWQNGQSEPESQNQDYRQRAHFFSEEVKHGNFSLLLTNVTSKDAGVYRCVVYTEKESDEASIEIKEADHLIVTGGHAVSAHASEDVTLNCSIKSHLPLEQIEQIEWRKVDESILVLLYVNGEVLTDSSDERYRDRVELFSNEEVQKGNFSLRLKNVRTEDKGRFMCVAFHGDLSANTTVEVQQLDFSFSMI